MSIPMIVSFISDSPWRTVDEHSHFRTSANPPCEVVDRLDVFALARFRGEASMPSEQAAIGSSKERFF
jgi:hypothetical protein